MADNSTGNDEITHMNHLQILRIVGISVQGGLGYVIWILILILGGTYYFCKNCIKCRNNRHHGNRETERLLTCNYDGESMSSYRLAYCNLVERITAWILVDLLRTPNVTKELDQDKKDKKVILRVGSTHSFVLGRNKWRTFLIFVIVLGVSFLLAGKILLDLFEQITQYVSLQSRDSDFTFGNEDGVTVLVICHFPENLTHQKYSTTWKMHCKMLREECSTGIFDNVLTTLSKIAGLYGLYVVICQTYLSIALNTCCKQCCYKRCCLLCSSMCMFIMLFHILPVIMTAGVLLKIFLTNTSLIGGPLCSDQYLLLFIIVHSMLLAQVITSYSVESEQQQMMAVIEDPPAQERSIRIENNISNSEEVDSHSHQDPVASGESGEDLSTQEI
jgi:hypothetical protein